MDHHPTPESRQELSQWLRNHSNTPDTPVLQAYLNGEPAGSEAMDGELGPLRCGYQLIVGSAQSGRLHPALARALTEPELEGLDGTFADLWKVDLSVHQLISSGDRETIMLAWLRSPGRRLLQQIDILTSPPSEQLNDGTDWSLAAIYRAAGVHDIPTDPAALTIWRNGWRDWLGQRPECWRELHIPLPGTMLTEWTRDALQHLDVMSAFRLLDEGSPVFLRGAAVVWLLDRSQTEPFYDVDGLRCDLREELPARLAAAFRPDASPQHRWLGGISSSLETLALQHAAFLTREDPHEPGRVFRCWGVARWLVGCLLASPIYGGDEENLQLRLHALLPKDAGVPHPDPWHPVHFTKEGLDIGEVALCGGILWHYQKKKEFPRFLPVPHPITQALFRVANRTLRRPAERSAEDRLRAQRGSELGWDFPHVAPPLISRWLMTQLNIGWVGQADPTVLRECLELLDEHPARHGWVPFALQREHESLDQDLRKLIAALFVRLRERPERPSPHATALLAASAIGELTPVQQQWALDFAMEASPLWRAPALDALAAAGEKRAHIGVFREALALMTSLIRRPSAAGTDRGERLNAALIALRRADASALPGRQETLRQIGQAIRGAGLDGHLALRRELRRLGLAEGPP